MNRYERFLERYGQYGEREEWGTIFVHVLIFYLPLGLGSLILILTGFPVKFVIGMAIVVLFFTVPFTWIAWPRKNKGN